MLFTNFLFLAPLTLAIPNPSDWRNTPQCSIDLALLAEDLGTAAVALWGDNDLPFPTNPAALVAMHDSLVNYLSPKYPDPCQKRALIVEIGEFFTSSNLNAIEARDTSSSTDLEIYEPLMTRGGIKISCRKCKKLIRKIVGVVAPMVCAEVAIAAGFTTANPVVGGIAGFLCLNAAKQFEETGRVELKVQKLRGGGGSGRNTVMKADDH